MPGDAKSHGLPEPRTCGSVEDRHESVRRSRSPSARRTEATGVALQANSRERAARRAQTRAPATCVAETLGKALARHEATAYGSSPARCAHITGRTAAG